MIEPSTSSICCWETIVKSSAPWRATQDPPDARDDLVDRRVFAVEHVDLVKALAIEQLQAARGRDVHRVVEIDRRPSRPWIP